MDVIITSHPSVCGHVYSLLNGAKQRQVGSLQRQVAFFYHCYINFYKLSHKPAIHL